MSKTGFKFSPAGVSVAQMTPFERNWPRDNLVNTMPQATASCFYFYLFLFLFIFILFFFKFRQGHGIFEVEYLKNGAF